MVVLLAVLTISMDIQINYLAVLAAGVSNMILGALWYGPLFGKMWMRLMGLSDDRLNELKNRGMGKLYASAFLMALVMAFVLAHFAAVWGAVTVHGAFLLAFWVWLGFIVTTMINSVLWEGKSMKLYFVNIGYQLVALKVMALILVLWR